MELYAQSATTLKAMLEAGETTSAAIIDALHARAVKVEPLVNGFAIPLWEEARVRAQAADEARAKGESWGLLHGLPLSVKENLELQGHPSTVGLVNRKSRVAEADALVIRMAREAGAILIGKTNVPQALIPFHCSNPVYGTSYNPWRRSHVTGGSSGGEAAVIASGSSAMGIGTDLGGSIRFPASFCGIAGFKPTTSRWSIIGSTTPIAGQDFIRPQTGPMARHVSDLALLMKALDSPKQSPYDSQVPPLAFADPASVSLAGMRIGYYVNDGFIEPSAANQRAVSLAMAAVQAQGATLVPMPPRNQLEAVQLYVGAVSADGMETLRRELAGEVLVDSLKMMWQLGYVPNSLRQTASKVLPWFGESRLGATLGVVGKKSLADVWSLTAKRNAMRVAEMTQWREAGIEAMLCPATATPAVPIGMDHDFSLIFSYFGRYNLLGMPAGVVPVTRVRANETQRPTTHDSLEKRAAAVQAASLGLPVNAQVVALPWQDHVALAVMAAIEAAARTQPDYPTTPVDPL